MVRYGIDSVDAVAPTAALEYARRLAQRGTPASLIVRCYRVGQSRFLRHCIEALSNQEEDGDRQADGEVSIVLIEQVSDYIDRVLEQVLGEYEQTRERRVQTRSAMLATRVRSVLDSAHVDVGGAESELGYRVGGHHLGLVVWVDDDAADNDPLATLSGLTTMLARSFGRSDEALFVPADDKSAWVWLPLARCGPVDHPAFARAITEWKSTVGAAVGEPGSGADGFRRTHQQALSALAVARAAGTNASRVVPFVDVAPIAFMCTDIDGTRAWVHETLGALAGDSERHVMLRETARVYLQTGGSYVGTAEQLFLHRNTAQYRVRKAEELRGRALRDGRLDAELALLACHWLGRTVLQPV
jgi:DNA-binding PucR family transcriptional regulator